MPRPEYSVQTNNRFILHSDNETESEDEGIQNVDPYLIEKNLVNQATKQAKQLAKQKIEAAKPSLVQKKSETRVEAQNFATPDQVASTNTNNNNNNTRRNNRRGPREPRANNGPRYGKRNPSGEENDESNAVENAGDSERRGNRDGYNTNRRQNRRPRFQDRQSGDPRTGARYQDRRRGGKQDNVPEEENNWDENATGDQEPAAVDPENADPENSDAAENPVNSDTENQEPEQPEDPKIELLTLDEYLSQQENVAVVKEPVRKANDGLSIKGRVLQNNTKIMNTMTYNERIYVPRDNVKNVISYDKLGFQSTRRSRRDDNRSRNNSATKTDSQPATFEMQDNLFPSLSK